MHPILKKHSVIAWDMDQTLVNGPNSEYFQDYIRRHPEKSHHIVTFRNKNWADTIFGELENIGFDAYKHISAVHSCPEDIHDSYMAKNSGGMVMHRFMLSRSMSLEQFNKNVSAFPIWKGFQCKKIGATIIIDDMPTFVVPGCAKYDIEFINALDPLHVKF